MGRDSRSSKRKKKRSQKHGKKSRSTKEKSKTTRPKRHYDTDSSSGEDVPSKLSLPCSSSSSEDVYRSKKRGRSCDRRDRKSSKKRSKRDRSMSSETTDESPRQKRKSKRSRDSKLKKKQHRKIRRREHSVSSSSSPSRNFSESECSDDSEREYERKEGNSETKKRKWREIGRERNVSMSKHSSRSFSLYSHDEERMDYQPKRLRSVIVAEIEKEEPKVEELIRDNHKDEIVYDHDDYPSKSNDSHDGPSGKDEVTCSDDATHEKTDRVIPSAVEPNREAIIPVVGASEISKNQSLGEKRTKQVIPSSVEPYREAVSPVRASKLSKNQNLGEKRTEQVIPSPVEPGISDHVMVGSNHDNLEAKLRQKALENLLKRQAKGLANVSTDNKEYHPGPGPEPNKQVFVDIELEPKSAANSSLLVQSESVRCQTNKEEKNVDAMHTTSALGTLNKNNPLWRYSAEKGNASVGHTLIRPKVGVSTPTRRLLGSSNTWRREWAPQEPLKSNHSLTTETNLTDGVYSSPPGAEAVKAENTTASEPSPSGEKSTKIETEDDDDSEFQQKTMSVIRGGELVQVSYKVKIPKKAAALARRQLKR